jgi:hypothetical protein
MRARATSIASTPQVEAPGFEPAGCRCRQARGDRPARCLACARQGSAGVRPRIDLTYIARMTSLPGRRVAVRCDELPAAGSRHATSTPRISCVRTSGSYHTEDSVRHGLSLARLEIFALRQGGGVGSMSLASGSSVSHPNTMSRICASTGRPAARTRGVRRARVRAGCRSEMVTARDVAENGLRRQAQCVGGSGNAYQPASTATTIAMKKPSRPCTMTPPNLPVLAGLRCERR